MAHTQNYGESIFMSKAEWPGLEHNRWLIEKSHFPEKRKETFNKPNCEYLPFISKRRVPPHPTEHMEFRPSLVVKTDKLVQTFEETPKNDRKLIKHPVKNIERPQRLHYSERLSNTWENSLGGMLYTILSYLI